MFNVSLQELLNYGLTHIRTSKEYSSLEDFPFISFNVFIQFFFVLRYFFFPFSRWSVVVNASGAGTARGDAYKPQYRYC